MTTTINIKLKGEDENKYKEVKKHLKISSNADTLRFLIREKHEQIIEAKS